MWTRCVSCLASVILTSKGVGGCGAISSPARAILFEDPTELTGSLAIEDTTNPLNRSYLDSYPLVLAPGQTLMVEMVSTEFDPVLEVWNDQGTVVAADDDSGLDVNAYLALRTLAGGAYTIQATSFGAEQTGSYEVRYGVGDVVWQEVITERLGVGDEVHPDDGSFIDEYELEVRAGQAVLVQLSSVEFDAYLELLNESGAVVARNDDHGGGSNALLSFRVERTGSHTIRVNTFAADEAGSYTLSYSTS